MGENFVALEEMEACGFTWPSEQRERLMGNIPFPVWATEICCKSHILFPSVEDTINDIRQKYPQLFRGSGDEYCMDILDTLPIANHKAVSRWQLVRKQPVKGSVDTKPLYDHEVVADVNTVIQSLVLWYRTRQKWLWENKELYAACENLILDDGSITVGTTPPKNRGGSGKIWMYDLWKNQPRGVLLLGAIEKFGTVYSFINRHNHH